MDAIGPQDLGDVNPIKPSVEATGVPAILSDQEFGKVYPLDLQGKTGAPGDVPDHVDRRVLYDLRADRIARDPDSIGMSFCAVLYDESHWRRAYDRGQPGFSISTASRNKALSIRSATRIYQSSIRFANSSTQPRSPSFTVLTMRPKPYTAVSWNSDLPC